LQSIPGCAAKSLPLIIPSFKFAKFFFGLSGSAEGTEAQFWVSRDYGRDMRRQCFVFCHSERPERTVGNDFGSGSVKVLQTSTKSIAADNQRVAKNPQKHFESTLAEG
jgi:hypothetical protein